MQICIFIGYVIHECQIHFFDSFFVPSFYYVNDAFQTLVHNLTKDVNFAFNDILFLFLFIYLSNVSRTKYEKKEIFPNGSINRRNFVIIRFINKMKIFSTKVIELLYTIPFRILLYCKMYRNHRVFKHLFQFWWWMNYINYHKTLFNKIYNFALQQTILENFAGIIGKLSFGISLTSVMYIW